MPERLRSAVVVGAVVLAAACTSDGDTTDVASGSSLDSWPGTGPVATPPSPSEPIETAPPATDGPAGVQPEGFTTATVRVTKADGEVCDVCMWLSDVGDERARGLMGVTDLGQAAGMAFVFPQPAEGAFYMFGTPTPLSIAWFAPGGEIVSSTDMDPCTTEAADCERYFADGEYRLAIEVFAGGLDELGIGPGSSAEVLAGTEAAACVVNP